MAIRNFRKLEVWQYSMNLVESVYNLISKILTDERFGPKSQVARCAISIPSNIAEGSGRSTNKYFADFLSISLGSCYELETQLILVNDIFKIDCEIAINECHDVQKMIFGLKSKLITDK